MGKGWAVGGAVTLALTVTTIATPQRNAGDMVGWLRLVALVTAYACWAYALALGAYGDKGALAALVVYAIALPIPGGAPYLRRIEWAFALPVMVLAAATALVTVMEMRSRRGPVRWGTAVVMSLPLVVAVPLLL